MEWILVLLIVALLNGAIAYIDSLLVGIVSLTLYAEQYMSTLSGVNLAQTLFDIIFGFGVGRNIWTCNCDVGNRKVV